MASVYGNMADFSIAGTYIVTERLRIAVLDDYLKISQKSADWSRIAKTCDITVIDRPLGVPDEAAQVLAPYNVLCLIRERMAIPGALIERGTVVISAEPRSFAKRLLDASLSVLIRESGF